jgi:hypothetical protein
MRTAEYGTGATAPAGPLLGALEGRAWRIDMPTRRLFLVLAVATAVAIALSSLVSAWVVAGNSGTISDAREEGLGVARAATEFRTNLVAADAEAATTLIAGGLETPEARERYDDAVVLAGRALTQAALVAPGDDRDDIEDLADGLVRYAGLVEAARANSRQGFPVGAAYLGQARTIADDELIPLAQRLGRSGEQRLARAANSVGGPSGFGAVAALAVGLVVLSGSAAVVAGRTRRLTHPALALAALAGVAAFAIVGWGVWSQGRELRAAATDDVEAYVAANDTAFSLSTMRITEINAVAARGSGAPLYAEFRDDADTLMASLRDDEERSGLLAAVERYVDAEQQVEAADSEGDSQRAADIVLTGDSATAFAAADDDVSGEGGVVARADRALADRLDAATDAEVAPLLPIALGAVAAGAAAVGVLARARRYR